MTFWSNLFYSLSILFLVLEVYQLFNRNKIYYNIKDIKDRKKLTIFYVLKLLYTIWIPIGIFSNLGILFISLLVTSSLKLLLLKSSNFTINMYDIVKCIINVSILASIFYLGLIAVQ